jgi:hypothetical protein
MKVIPHLTPTIGRLGLILTLAVSQAPAQAVPQAHDYFSRTTSAAGAEGQAIRTAADWFNKLDQIQAEAKPSEADRVVLTRPLNQELERVKQWVATAGKIARNYRSACRQIKSMPIPKGCSGISQYRDLLADWYGDSAQVYEDLIRPRPPAKTMEELEGQLDEVSRRAQSNSQTRASLTAMENNLRQTYQVPVNDAFQQYVSGK